MRCGTAVGVSDPAMAFTKKRKDVQPKKNRSPVPRINSVHGWDCGPLKQFTRKMAPCK